MLVISGFGLYMITNVFLGRFRRFPWEFIALSMMGALISAALALATPSPSTLVAAFVSGGQIAPGQCAYLPFAATTRLPAAFTSPPPLSGTRGRAPFVDVLQRLWDGPRPVVVAANGHAFGGGVGLVAAADVAIAVEPAGFSFSEVGVGVIPAMISVVVLPTGPLPS